MPCKIMGGGAEKQEKQVNLLIILLLFREGSLFLLSINPVYLGYVSQKIEILF